VGSQAGPGNQIGKNGNALGRNVVLDAPCCLR